MEKDFISKIFYLDADYKKSALYTAQKQDRWSRIVYAKSLLFLGRFDEAYFEFRQLNLDYEAGYCQLLKGYDYLAEKIWLMSNPDAFDVSWGLSVVSFLHGERIKYPLYFQIRAFLEQDVNMLYFAKRNDYAEKLLVNAPLFAQINPESYKFFGRVLFHNAKYEIAKELLNLSLDVCYKDPETHFLIACLHLVKGENSLAQKSLKTAIDVSDGYYPAEKILSDLR